MLFLYGWVTRVDDMTAKGPAMPMKMKTKITWTKWLPYSSHCPYASSLKRRFISIEDKSLCFCERTLCKQRNIWEVGNSRGRKLKTMTKSSCPLSKGMYRRRCSPMMGLAPERSSKLQIWELSSRGSEGEQILRQAEWGPRGITLLFTAHVKMAHAWI